MELGHDTVEIIRPAKKNAFGDPTGPPAAPRRVTGCSVQPASSSEQTDQRDTVTTSWRVFLPGGTDLAATDRVRWNGAEYEVIGEPDRWAPDGQDHHVQAQLRRVRG